MVRGLLEYFSQLSISNSLSLENNKSICTMVREGAIHTIVPLHWEGFVHDLEARDSPVRFLVLDSTSEGMPESVISATY